MQLVACIYEADILKDSVMEKWEETGNINWAKTLKHFVKEYGVVTMASERAAQRTGFESAAAFREHIRSILPLENTPPPAAPGPSTKEYKSMTTYAKALEQDNPELRSVGGRSSENTSLRNIPENAASASAIATNATMVMME